jgi:hypothetical protein
MKQDKAEIFTGYVRQVLLHMLKVSKDFKFLALFYDRNIGTLRNHKKWNLTISDVQRVKIFSSTINVGAKISLEKL